MKRFRARTKWDRHPSRRFGLGLLFLICVVILGGCTEKDIPLPDHRGGQLYHGKVRGDIKCYACHGWLGEGSGHAPSLTRAAQEMSRQSFSGAVRFGIDGVMPAYGKAISKKDILLIIEWLEMISIQPQSEPPTKHKNMGS